MRKVLALCGTAALLAASAMAGDGKAAACCASMDSVKRSVSNVDNGVRIVMSATDAKVVAALQEKAPECVKSGCDGCPMHSEAVTRTVEKTADGVVVTATSTDAAVVATLQKHAAAGAGACTRSEAKAAGCCAKGKAEAAGCAHGEAAPKTT